jgi:hypothetical protein
MPALGNHTSALSLVKPTVMLQQTTPITAPTKAAPNIESHKDTPLTAIIEHLQDEEHKSHKLNEQKLK